MIPVRYVMGFVFEHDLQRVLLIFKTAGWQADRYNGIGGHIEDIDDTPQEAMAREFLEEAGTSVTGWEQRFILHVRPFEHVPTGAVVHCFRATLPEGRVLLDRYTAAEGRTAWIPVRTLDDIPLLPNLLWIIRVMADPELGVAEFVSGLICELGVDLGEEEGEEV